MALNVVCSSICSCCTYIKIYPLGQGWAAILETGPAPSNIFFEEAKRNKKNEYNCCNKTMIKILKNFYLNILHYNYKPLVYMDILQQ